MHLNQTAYVVLGLLSVQPNLSGYDIRNAVQNSVGYFWSESYGQIYPTLKGLVAEGLIEPCASTPTGRRKRQVYSLSEAGRVQLRQWLSLPFQNDPPRNEFLLKLFFGAQALPGVSAAHVRDLQERNQRMLDTLMKIEASVPAEQSSNPHLPYWMLTLSLGKALTLTALEWSASALLMLSAQESARKPLQVRRSKSHKSPASSGKKVPGKTGSARTQRRVKE